MPRALLQPLAATDLSGGANFPYMLRAGGSLSARFPVLPVRVTYVGRTRLGVVLPAVRWAPLGSAQVWEAGAEHGLVGAGYEAIDSLRLEKGYRVWGADITPEESPLAAGLGGG